MPTQDDINRFFEENDCSLDVDDHLGLLEALIVEFGLQDVRLHLIQQIVPLMERDDLTSEQVYRIKQIEAKLMAKPDLKTVK